MQPWTFPTSTAPAPFSSGGTGRVVLEDFKPLAQSLEWRLGQEYLRKRGSLAFIGDAEPVPFVVNNDGGLSLRAAEVFFASLQEADKAGDLRRDIFVLELGIGVGLFARFFLDRMRQLCQQHGKDWYGRLTYIAADRSARMLRDAGRRGVFQDHPGRYRLRLIDAMKPEEVLKDPDVAAAGPGALRAVFLNYLLDCLPAAVVRAGGAGLEELHVRTCLPPGQAWKGLTDAGAEDLRRLARLPGADGAKELQDVYPLCVAEYEYRPVAPGSVPQEGLALAKARAAGGAPVLHSHGAMTCLEGLAALLGEGGFVLANDYGQAKEAVSEGFEHQRFSLATFVGVNFPLLASWAKEMQGWRWCEPEEGEASVHARLLLRWRASATQQRFMECFARTTQEWVEEPALRARAMARGGRARGALEAYRQALERQPFGWPLLAEVSQLLAFALQDPRAGLEAARRALRLNPACSADLWNAAGDCLFDLGRTDEAGFAFRRALEVSGDDVRARYNLAFVHARRGEHALALARIAEGLALDAHGIYHERLLRKQGEVLGLLAEQRRLRLLGQADRVQGSVGQVPERAAPPKPGEGR